MPSAKLKTPILTGHFYHIYNRGNNREKIFFTQANYEYFLRKYQTYLAEHVDTYAYCLIPNHFHLIIQAKNQLVSRQFQKLFQSYALSINKQEDRTGSLFQKTFRRILITDNVYLKRLVFYIHFNPEKHFLTKDYKSYKFSSYKSVLLNGESIVNQRALLELFGDYKSYKEYHKIAYNSK